MPDTKMKQAKLYFLYGNKEKALSIAKSFRIGLTKEEQAVLRRGHEARVTPAFYAGLGLDPEELVKKAHVLFEEKFLKERPCLEQ